jgi:SP family arabinose:H+ symporter-like MFS transporter
LTGPGRRIFLWSITSALAGFLFGFDTVVISGAEKTIQTLWHLNPFVHGLVIAAALYGTVAGSLLGGWPPDRFGRRASLIFIGILYLIGAVGSALATDVYIFIVARFIGGVGIGMSTIAAPLYIAEISPPGYRGRLAGLFQFNIVFGIVVAYASNALLSGSGADAWRYMIGVAALPSLLNRCRQVEGLRVLQLIRPEASPKELQAEADLMIRPQTKAATPFWSRSLRTPILLAILIAVFNQMSGINAILYFAPRIFELTGLGAKAALLQSVGIGLTNLVATFAGLWLIDRLGRRTLLIIGSLGYIASLSLVAFAFFTALYAIVPICIFAFIAAHAIGQGVVIWVYIAEIFPTEHRAEGQALGSFTHWLFAALLTTIFPALVQSFQAGYVFAFFAAMMVLQLIWAKTMVIETKGVTLEKIEQRIH